MIAFVFQRASQCEVPFGSLQRASARCIACAYYGGRLHAGDKVRVFLKNLSTRHGARRLAVSVFRRARRLASRQEPLFHMRETPTANIWDWWAGGETERRRERRRKTTRQVQRGASAAPPVHHCRRGAAIVLAWTQFGEAPLAP